MNVDNMTFMTDFNSIHDALEATGEMLSIISGDNEFPLDGLYDVTTVLKKARIEGSFITAEELMRIGRSLRLITEISTFLTNARNEDGTSPYPIILKETTTLTPFPTIVKLIDRIIDQYGNVRDNASPQLAQIRSELSRISGTVNSIMRKVMTRAIEQGYLESDATPSVRDGRLVLPVSPMNKRKIQGIVHDESASGKTFFIEPAEVVEVNNRQRELELEERREIARILTAVTAELRPSIPEMLESNAVMGRLDFIHAKALYARQTDAHLPYLSQTTELEWYHATHPVLLESLQRQEKEIIPLDITLNANQRILIISGPNAGGKSVCLKTVGIVQYMAQCGLLPTLYENSHLGIFSDIFIDIGDDQSIEDDLSTYSSHLRNMRYFLSHGRAESLILIDEFGGGTEPQIGGAIAQAILNEFNSKQMWGVITTHYQNLKHFAEETDGLVNGSMLYDRQKMQPLFRLSIGNPGSSFAIEIARKTGLPASIIAHAEEIVGSDYINMDKYLLDIARDKRYWENKRLAIRQKEKKVEQVLAKYEEDADTLRSKRREILAEAKEEAKRILDGSNASIERAIREIRTSQAEKERTMEARRRLEKEKQELMADKPSENKLLRKAPKKKNNTKTTETPIDGKESSRQLKVGDNVKLDGQGTPGTITGISGQNAIVVFGMLKTTVRLNRLRPTISKPQSTNSSSSFVSAATTNNLRERQLAFRREIDVRGMRVDEAIQAVTYFIDDAVQFNQSEVRILHGTGTGALRQALRQYLDSVNGVESYRDEHVQFGGAGITVVSLS